VDRSTRVALYHLQGGKTYPGAGVSTPIPPFKMTVKDF